jgi:hypothetical protein
MVRTSALIIVMTISVFMLYGGCNGDNVLTTDEAPPGAEAPAGQSPECQNCPCKYFEVPMTEDCWGEPSDARFTIALEQGDPPRLDSCTCRVNRPDRLGGLSVQIFAPSDRPPNTECTSTLVGGCTTGAPEADTCPGHPRVRRNIIGNQNAACRTCLEQYAMELNASGIMVTGGPPYICAPPSP